MGWPTGPGASPPLSQAALTNQTQMLSVHFCRLQVRLSSGGSSYRCRMGTARASQVQTGVLSLHGCPPAKKKKKKKKNKKKKAQISIQPCYR